MLVTQSSLVNRFSVWLLVVLALLGSACSTVNIWPFAENRTVERSRGPENATGYRCDGGKGFHVRYLEAGAAAWLIFPDRQVRLDKVSGSSPMLYSNGIATLTLGNDSVTLSDGPAAVYVNCKQVM